jgi:hypothetical protein
LGVLLGEHGKNYTCTVEEQPNVIVLTKNEYYKELYFKQDAQHNKPV